jgi:hypothetical protein
MKAAIYTMSEAEYRGWTSDDGYESFAMREKVERLARSKYPCSPGVDICAPDGKCVTWICDAD